MFIKLNQQRREIASNFIQIISYSFNLLEKKINITNKINKVNDNKLIGLILFIGFDSPCINNNTKYSFNFIPIIPGNICANEFIVLNVMINLYSNNPTKGVNINIILLIFLLSIK